jgi:hypothetical protein
VPTPYAIRSPDASPLAPLRSWLVKSSADGKDWQMVDHKENSEGLNGKPFTRTFAVAPGRPCRFIRLVNIGRSHSGDDRLSLSAFELFGSLLEQRTHFSVIALPFTQRGTPASLAFSVQLPFLPSA